MAEREVKKLGAALARHTGQEEGEAISHLWGRLGVLLQRGNAAILGKHTSLKFGNRGIYSHGICSSACSFDEICTFPSVFANRTLHIRLHSACKLWLYPSIAGCMQTMAA